MASGFMPKQKILVLERVLGSEAGFVAAKNSKNGLKSTFCPQDTPVEREALPQTLSRTKQKIFKKLFALGVSRVPTKPAQQPQLR